MQLSRFCQTVVALAVSAGAQTVPLAQNVLTNKDVVTLAKAGFNEEFIVDTIAMSRTRFDVSVNALAELAKDGLTERLIRCMMTVGAPPPSAAAPYGQAMPEAVMAAPVMAGNPRMKGKTYVIKPSATRQALSSQTPYYEWKSMFWGLWKKQVGVGAVPHSEQVVAPTLGGYFNQVRMPMTSPTPAAPQPQNPYYQVPTRYVVLQ
jgi:hypothetical protein